MNKWQERDFITDLYEKNRQTLFNYAYSQFKDAFLANDLVADTFETALININKLNKSQNPEGWLMETMKNKILHKKRDLASHPEVVCFDFVEDIATPEVSESILTASGLTADEEKLIKMVYYNNIPMEEAAKKLHITPDACRKRVQRIRDKLRKLL